MSSNVGRILQTASHQTDRSILYAFVFEKSNSHMCKNSGNPELLCNKNILIVYRSIKKNISLRNISKVFSHFNYTLMVYAVPYFLFYSHAILFP